MHRKSSLQTAEVTVLPVIPAIADQGDGRQRAVPTEPQVSSPAEGSGGAETYQADRALHAMLAHLTGGISPAALLLAYTDWLSHLASSPQRRMEIAQEALIDARRVVDASQHFFSSGQEPWSLIKPQPQDKRFGRPEWEQPPFNLMAQAFLVAEQWWHNATTGVRGVAKQDEAIVEFSVRQMLDVLSPSNFAPTNPEVLKKAFESGGANFVRGWQNFCDDWVRAMSPPHGPVETGDFVVGKTVASRAARSYTATI
jgi:poly[(R)-3-hydroxyalkanoate] polymerase subunit PhaC